MTEFEWITTLLSILTLILIPGVVLLVRTSMRWTRTEDRITNLLDDMGKLVADKDAVHREMLTQMREDRAVTDRRLRWLEENLWRARPGRPPVRGQ